MVWKIWDDEDRRARAQEERGLWAEARKQAVLAAGASLAGVAPEAAEAVRWGVERAQEVLAGELHRPSVLYVTCLLGDSDDVLAACGLEQADPARTALIAAAEALRHIPEEA